MTDRRNQPLVSLDQASVMFDGNPVVDHVSLTVNRGDIVTIIGPNGAGKTTLIKAVLGIQPLTHGTIRKAPSIQIGYVPSTFSCSQPCP